MSLPSPRPPQPHRSHRGPAAWRAATVAAVCISATLPPRAASAQQAGSPTGVSRVVPPSPAPAGFIHDGAHVLTAEAKRTLNERITAVQQRTGGDIGVAIVTDLRGYAGAPAEAGGDASEAAASLRDPTPDERGGFPWLWLAGLGVAGTGVAAAVSGWKRYQRRKPRPCPAGHGLMMRLDEAADDVALSPAQRAEERVESVDYDVWACASCSERLVVAYSRWSSYKGCPKCQARTLSSTIRTVTAATQFSTGLEETTLHCEFCALHDVTSRVTPVLPPPSSSSSSSSGSSSGGSSFGGSGRTAGGGGGASY